MLLATCIFAGLGPAIGAAADGWDEFANNMATDLAPVISLFGEQVTKQYLSESITWTDYFIFAMAPIGIITALVSAIRVCGSPSLRAFIGRAKEGASQVEIEVLSSTSHDVCELYNSGGIARVLGRPKILEVVQDLDASESAFTDWDGDAGISTFEVYLRSDNGQQEWTNSNRDSQPPNLAPNLSHNVGIKRLDHSWFVMVAILGFLLQGGVLAFAATATYALKWQKNGAQPPRYACPMAILGTVLVCGGVFLCALLVGESTEERIYTRTGSADTTVMHWVQPRQVLGDQTFGSFCHSKGGNTASLSQYVVSWKKQNTIPGGFVWITMGLTSFGFVVQFVGFRGIHSAISMAQLGAALIMSIARAALRTQRLDVQDNEISRESSISHLVEGHELDWLAFRLYERHLEQRGKVSRVSLAESGRHLTVLTSFRSAPRENEEKLEENRTQNPHATPSDTKPKDWVFFLFCRVECSDKGLGPGTRFSPAGLSSGGYCATRLLAYRRALAKITDSTVGYVGDGTGLSRHFTTEMVSVRETARKLAEAIESVTDIVMRSTSRLAPEWQNARLMSVTMDCATSSVNEAPELGKTLIELQRPYSNEGTWSLTSRQHLEAALGVWNWSIIRFEEQQGMNKASYRFEPVEGTSRKFSPIRLVSPNAEFNALSYYDLLDDETRWYERVDIDTGGKVQCCTPTTLWRQEAGNPHRVYTELSRLSDTLNFPVKFFGWYNIGRPWSPLTTPDASAAASQSPHHDMLHCLGNPASMTNPLSYCAQELLGCFVRRLLEAILDAGEADVSKKGFLQNQMALDLVDAITKTGLASRKEAAFCVVPQVALREYHDGRTQLWHAAKIGHETLVENILEGRSPDDAESSRVFGESLYGGCFDINLTDAEHKRSPLWVAAANGHDGVVKLLLGKGAETDGADKSGLTPLLVAASNGHQKVVQLLLDTGRVGVNSKNSDGNTALWFAAEHGHRRVVEVLLEKGPDVDSQNRLGKKPVDIAKSKGHETVVEILYLYEMKVQNSGKGERKAVEPVEAYPDW